MRFAPLATPLPAAAAAASRRARARQTDFALIGLRWLILAALLGSTACSSLPPLPPRTSSAAADDASTRTTRLAAIERASLAGASAGESGFRLLPTGDFAFDARLALVERAERTLDVQYYLIQRDGVGLQFLRELREAAARGVRVRLLVDDLYSSGKDELFATLAACENVEVRLFNPLPARGGSLVGRLLLSLREFTRINHRMHNKLLVADNRFAVTGGRNMADEYFMRSTAANFIDMDVVVAGPVVRELSKVFDRYWNSEYAYPVETVVRLPFDRDTARRRFDEATRDASPGLAPAPSDPLGAASVELGFEAGRLAMTFATAEVFADAPAKVSRRRRSDTASTVARSVLEAFDAAQTELVVASPYFIPGTDGMANIKALRQRRVQISIVTNSLGATDEPLVHWRYAGYRRDLLRLGVQIYELSPDLARSAGSFGDFGKSFGRLHAKVAVIDRRQVFVGSMNLDERSAWSNTEAGLLIDSPALAAQIQGLIDRDRRESVYQLRLAADDDTIEWVSTSADGQETVVLEEPHSDWLLRLKRWLLEPFASEELL